MQLSLAIILGLTGAVCWGGADFAARFASRRVGAYRTLFFMQFFGFVALSVYLKFRGGFFEGVALGWHPWALATLAGVINMVASLSLYYSFQIGVMSIVAPVSSAYPALTVALAIASGERITALRGVGLAVTLVGVILAATTFTPSAANPVDEGLANETAGKESAAKETTAKETAHLSKGVVWALLAALGFGVLFWFLGFYVVPAVGPTISVWVIRLTSFSVLAAAAFPTRQSLKLPSGRVWWLLAAVGFLDTAAFVANNAGLSTGQVSVVSVLASLYGAVTVLFAWIFLREKLERTQWLGIILIFAGIVLVSL
ncbi:MAG TPA: DMT family transporter [Candidatus Acidoferrales bacterium]